MASDCANLRFPVVAADVPTPLPMYKNTQIITLAKHKARIINIIRLRYNFLFCFLGAEGGVAAAAAGGGWW